MSDQPDRTPKDISDPFVLSLVAEVKKERVAQDISQKKLAEISGVGRSGIVAFEQGQRMPTIWFCKSIADGLGLTLAELIGRAESSRS